MTSTNNDSHRASMHGFRGGGDTLNADARNQRHDQARTRGRALIALVADRLPHEFDVGPGVDLWPAIGTALLSRIATTMRQILELQPSQLEADAATLTRSLYEHAVHFVWLAADPSPARINHWQKHDLVQRLKMDDDMRRHGVPMIEPSRRAEYEHRITTMTGSVPLRTEQLAMAADDHWAGKLKAMGKRTEVTSFSGWYASLFRGFSSMAHPSEIGLYRVTEQLRPGRVRIALEQPSTTRTGPYGMATLVFAVALLAASESLVGWPSEDEIFAIFAAAP